MKLPRWNYIFNGHIFISLVGQKALCLETKQMLQIAIAVDKRTHTAVIENENSCILYYDVLDYKNNVKKEKIYRWKKPFQYVFVYIYMKSKRYSIFLFNYILAMLKISIVLLCLRQWHFKLIT